MAKNGGPRKPFKAKPVHPALAAKQAREQERAYISAAGRYGVNPSSTYAARESRRRGIQGGSA